MPVCEIAESIHVEIGDGRGKKRQRLRDDQAADNRNAQRLTRIAPAPKPIAIGSVPRSAACILSAISWKNLAHSCDLRCAERVHARDFWAAGSVAPIWSIARPRGKEQMDEANRVTEQR
jgi:hypothetical protein